MAEDAGSIYSKVEIQLNKLDGQIRSVNQKLDGLSGQSKKRQKEFSGGWNKAFGQFNLAGVAAVAGVSAAITGAINTFATFEQSMANVASVAGATEAEFEKLTAAALEMGRTTRFTASQASEALYALASAGFDASESVGALEGTLLLAGATGSELGFTAQTVTAVISQFGKSADDAGDIANTFAAAISNSQANMDKLANAFRQVGPVAAGVGRSLEETTGALQILFNAGFQGENAGLALKSALAELSNEGSATSKKLQELGVDLSKVNPITNDLASVFGTLQESGLGAKETFSAFGKIAGGQILTLINAGREGIEEYTAAVTDTNKAAEAYATQNDTLQGSMDSLGSAVEGLSISLGSSLEPVLRPLVDAFRGIVSFLSKAPQGIKALIGSFLGLTAAIVGVSQAAAIMGVALPSAFGPIGLAMAGITAAVVGIISHMKKAKVSASNLEQATDRLKRVSEEYRKVNEKLEGSLEDLAGAERTLLEIQRKRLRGEIRSALTVLVQDYTALKDVIDKTKGSAGLAFVNVSRLLRDGAKQAGLTAEELKKLNELDITPGLSTKELLEGSNRIYAEAIDRARKLGKSYEDLGINAEELAAAQAEYSKASLESINTQESLSAGILEVAKAYKNNGLDISFLLGVNTELYDEIIRVSKTLKDETDVVEDNTTATEEETEAIEENIEAKRKQFEESTKYQDALRDLILLNREQAAQKTINEGVVELTTLRVTTGGDEESEDQAAKEAEINQRIKKALEERAAVFEERRKIEQESLREEFDMKREAYENDLAALQSVEEQKGNLTDGQIEEKKYLNDQLLEIEENYLEEKDALDAIYREKEMEQIAEHDALLIEAEQKTQDELAAIRKAAAERAKTIALGSFRFLAGGLNDFIDYKKSRYDKDSKEYKKAAKAQFYIGQSFSALQAGIAGAEAAVKAYNSLAGIPIVGPGLGIAAAAAVGTFTAAQVGFILGKKPPAFQTGGIVPGNSFAGDQVLARVNSGELILNGSQQSRLFDFLNGRAGVESIGGGAAPATNMTVQVVTPTGDIIKEYLYNASKEGTYKVDARAVINE